MIHMHFPITTDVCIESSGISQGMPIWIIICFYASVTFINQILLLIIVIYKIAHVKWACM